MKAAFPLSNRTHVGDNIAYQCKVGYTRLHANTDRITCEAADGIPKWKGKAQIKDCYHNYCDISDLKIEHAQPLLNTTRGNIPEGIQAISNISMQYFDGAVLTYRCDPNFHFNNSEVITTRCIFPTNQIGFGHWELAKIFCTRKHFTDH